MNFGSQILILYAVEFFAALNNTCISARTLALLLLYNSYIRCCPYKRHNTNKTNVPADLHELLSAAKNLPELNIRIFQSAYFLFF